MSLIRVLTDIGEHKPVSLLAKITEERSDGTYIIRYLTQTNEKAQGRYIYRYEDDTYQIDDESVTEYLNTDDETDRGFECVQDGWIKIRDIDDDAAGSDDDYVPSDEDENEEDENEEDDDEEYDDDDQEEYIDQE
jgi:hypothetical protein